MDPILKWTGGKRWLAKALAAEISAKKPKVYVEPFLGAGAVALQIQAERYLLGDANDALINVWRCAVNTPNSLFLRIRQTENRYQHTEAGYSEVQKTLNAFRRDKIFSAVNGNIADLSEMDRGILSGYPTEMASWVLYLIAHGYNGMWRENKSGEQNIPFGGHHQMRFKFLSMEKLRELSKLLRGKATFFATDFEEVIDEAPSGAILYADPPYIDKFDGYTKEGFPESMQRRLAAALHRAAMRGVEIYASNSYHPLVHELYSWAKIADVNERWSVGATGARRGKAPCVLIHAG